MVDDFFGARKGLGKLRGLFPRKGCNRLRHKVLVVTLLTSSVIEARNIYLNGVDISGARNQELTDVSLHIDGNGDVFIAAKQYEAKEEDTYVPLVNPVNLKPMTTKVDKDAKMDVTKVGHEAEKPATDQVPGFASPSPSPLVKPSVAPSPAPSAVPSPKGP